MPKVTDEYLTDKKNFIIECTGEILKEKPLYLVTMRDIIKKAAFSQGVIYRYYANLDEIYIDFINKHTGYQFLDQRLDAILSSGQTEKIILTKYFIALGEYIEELMKTIVGKIFFELTVLYAYDLEKRTVIFPKLKFKQSLECAQNKIVEYILNNVENGIFHPKIPVNSIVQFVCVFIDGIAQSMAINMAKISESALNIPDMFQTLSKAVIRFLEV